jgi:hypothetical protein
MRGRAYNRIDHRLAIAWMGLASSENRGAQFRLRALHHNFEVAAAEFRECGIRLRSLEALVDRRQCANQIRARIRLNDTSFSRVFRHGG